MFTLSDFYNIVNHLDGTTVVSLDANTKVLATSEKSLSTQLFTNTIDQIPYATDDYKRLKNFLIDWYSAHRTLISTQKNISDVFSLPGSSKRELFNGFGYPFSISYLSSDTKSLFFLDLVNLYKVKGTPQTLIDVLQYYGLSDIDLAEYWLEKDSGHNLIFRSERYLPPGVLDISFSNISFNNMTENDPHWMLSEQQVENLILANKIALPSKSPYFSIRPRYNLTELIAIMSIISRRVQDAYVDYVATETLLRDIKLTNLNLYVSFLELYLSCIYTFTSVYHINGSSDPLFFCYDGTSVPSTSIVLSQYDDAISRVYSRSEFKSKLSEFYDLFTREMTSNFLETYDPGILLSEMNDTLYNVLNLYLDSDNGVELLNYLINDLNAWVVNNLGPGYPNLATTILGLGSLIDLNKIINFFKPYHARIKTLEFALIIDNPLCDSVICEDSVIDNPIETIIDFDTADSTACLTCVDGTAGSDCEFYYSREKYDCGSQFDIGASIDGDPAINIQDEISDILNFHRDSTSSNSYEQILFADPVDMDSTATFCDGTSTLTVVTAGGWTDLDYGGTFDGQHGNDIVQIYIEDIYPDPDPDPPPVPGVAWTTTSSLNQAKYLLAGCGTISDALCFVGSYQGTEIWNGSSWATTSVLNVSRYDLAGCGTTSDALSFGGFTSSFKDTTEIWNGSSWATTSPLNEAKRYLAGCGTTSDALSFGGFTGSNVKVNTTEIWNGSSWANTSLLNESKSHLAGCGDIYDALCFGGYTGSVVNTTEIWNGSWATTSLLNESKHHLAGCGTTSYALCFGGNTGVLVDTTEIWNGSSWATTSSLNEAKYRLAGCGNISDALCFGGDTGATIYTTEIWS